MWFPKQNMGPLLVATVEKLLPCRDTQMAAEGALETGPGPSPVWEIMKR